MYVWILILIFIVIYVIVFHYEQIDTFKNSCVKNTINNNNLDIYLINLNRNLERRHFFIEQYQKSDLNTIVFKRISAIDGKQLNIQEFVTPLAYKEIRQIHDTGHRIKHYQLTEGAVGCYLSHLIAYDHIASNDKEYGLIFEDDVKIDVKILNKINKLVNSIPNDWDILLLSCHCIICDKKEIYYNTERFFWLHSYIIKKESAKKLSLMLKKKLVEQQIDSELSDMATKGIIKIYCSKENMSQQTGFFATEIQTPVKLTNGIDPYISILAI